MNRILTIVFLTLLVSKAWATGEPSTRFNIYVPPNNDPVKRDVCLVITALYDSTSFTIIDDSLDGDNDDSKTGVLMAGQSYILYIRDNGINDDAQYASGGVLKQDGDYFNITSDKLIFASQSTNSDWQHDWVPSVNKSSLGEKFIIYAPKITSSNRDLNVFAYSDSTFVTIRKISLTPTTITGYTNVNMYSSVIVSQRMLNRGQDLIYAYTDGRDVMISGETYVVECSKPATVQYGALWGNERDGGGYVPTSNGSSSGALAYFAVPYQSGTSGEQEIRIVSWDDNNAITLERYSGGTWVAVKSWTVNRLKAVDWVGRNNGNVSYANVFRVTCTAGKRVSVFEGNWFETGNPGTSDMATMVSGEGGTSAGTRFLTYMAPPGTQNNVRNPFTGQLFAQRLTHVYLFASADTAKVTVKDAFTGGTKLSRSYTIAPGRYVDCFLTETEWKNIYNGTGTIAGGAERPYLLIESDHNISVMNSNSNDNWMMYFGTSQEQSFGTTSSSTKEYAKVGDTINITTAITFNTQNPVTDVDVNVVCQSGLKVIGSTFNNHTQNTQINGDVKESDKNTNVTFTNVPDLQPGSSYTVNTTVVTQISENNGKPLSNNSVINVETVTTGTVDGVKQQSVSTESVTINTNSTSHLLFSQFGANTFADSTDSWTCSCVDVNNDGYDDAFFTERDKAKSSLLYINNKSGGFARQTGGSIANDKSVTVSNTWGDIDNDGDIDLLSVNNTYKPKYLHLNNGSGTFTSVPAGNFTKDVSYYHGASWIDFDRDGYLDVFLTNYMPTRFNELYKNNQNGTFTKVEDGVLSVTASQSVGNTWADYDNDGLEDLFIPENRGGSNKLYHNGGNGSFTEVTGSVVTNDGGFSVGSCWGDIDNDGDLDLFVANASGKTNYLYRNLGGGQFAKDTASAAVKDAGQSHGCAFIDLDNDADLDLYVTSDKGFKFLYMNDGTGHFSKRTNEVITANFGNAFGQSWCDIDHDGDLDVLVATHTKQPNKVFVNNCTGKNWIAIKLVGTASNKSAVGGRIYVKTGNIWQMREVNSQSGFGGQNSYRQHFGLGTAGMIDSIKIVWPSGLVDVYTGVNVNQYITYTENNTQKVTGIVYHDANANCQQDANEQVIPFATVTFGNRKVKANKAGEFAIRLAAGTYQANVLADATLNQALCGSIPVTVTNTNITGVAIPALAICQDADLQVTLGTTVLRKGFKNTLKLRVVNKGLNASGSFTLTLKLDQHVVARKASTNWNTQASLVVQGKTLNTYTWQIAGLNSGEELNIDIEDSVKLTAVIGTPAVLEAVVLGLAADCDATDNTVTVNDRYVGAVDPNEKYVNPEGGIVEGQELTYKIAFENVGNYAASFVEITDELHPHLDMTTLKFAGSSHPVEISVNNRTITWFFRDINLPDSGTCKEASQGFVAFTIKPVSHLPGGSFIPNKAAIVFDYNDPIQTATTQTWIKTVIGDVKDLVMVYPNPAINNVAVRVNPYAGDQKIAAVDLLDLTGTTLVSSKQQLGELLDEQELTIAGIAGGMYVLHIRLNDGTIIRKPLMVR